MPNERGRGLLKKTKNNFWNLESMSPDDDDDDSDDGVGDDDEDDDDDDVGDENNDEDGNGIAARERLRISEVPISVKHEMSRYWGPI